MFQGPVADYTRRKTVVWVWSDDEMTEATEDQSGDNVVSVVYRLCTF